MSWSAIITRAAVVIVAAVTILTGAPAEATSVGPSVVTTPDVDDVGNGFFRLNDEATLSGGFNPTGTLTFQLLDPSSTLVYTDVVIVAGDGTYFTAVSGNNPGGFMTSLTGTWTWNVSYSGDANNAGTTADREVFPVGAPAPEPATLSLLGIAAGGLAVRRRRRRTAA